ncbi:glutathionylspermidine synthase family protein [Chryseobacterium indoltheticum]|uniref:glutathionylspermidine synthase family protein n=1 Tax=Chryseobacterium indoltheticum TaxID=254 RepID=UPI003F49A18F
MPESFRNYIITSWEEDHPSIYGRFDFGFDGENLKLLEFNADTPTSLYEASVIQWYWSGRKCFPTKISSILFKEKLVDYWKYLEIHESTLHLFCFINEY